MLVKTIKIMAIALLALSLKLSADEAWLPQASGFEATARYADAIVIVNPDVVWAQGRDGSGGGATLKEFTRTSNGGALWTPGEVTGGTLDASYGLGNISAISSNKAWAAIYPTTVANTACGIYATTDGGATWTKQTSATQYIGGDAFPNVVHMFDEMNGFTMGDPNVITDAASRCFEIYTTADGGVTWNRVPKANIAAGLTPTSGEYGTVDVYAAVGNTAWFGTNKGKMLKTTDKGLTWTINTAAAATGKAIIQVEFRNENNGILLYNSGSSSAPVYKYKRTSDGGTTWTDLNPTGSIFNTGLAYVPGTEKTWVSVSADQANMGSSYSKDDGETWTAYVDAVPTQYTDVAFFNPTTGWAGSFNTGSTEGGMYKFAMDLSDVGINGSDNQPSSVALMQNYPNPFNPTTTISFEVKSAGSVKLSIFDAAGKMVSELVNGTVAAGLHNVEFNAANLNSGVYFYKLQTAGISQTKKMMLVK